MATLLTVRRAAGRLGVSYSTLKQWIYKGAVRTVRTSGGHHRIAESELDRLLARQSGARASVRRRPGDAPIAISGRNQLRGIVEEVRVEGLLAQIQLRLGDQRLNAVITRDAVDALQLKHGIPAIAVIKSTEVMIAVDPEADRPIARRRGRVARSARRAHR